MTTLSTLSHFTGKTVLITGGNSGIGYATARLFAEAGAHVFITGRREDAVHEAVERLGHGVVGFVADASDRAASARVLDNVKAKHDGLDVLFLNAGIAPSAPIALQTEQGFGELFRTNFEGPYFTLQAALPLLRSGGAVVLNTSVTGVKGFPGSSVYAATKAALRSLTRTAAAELAPVGVRVNAVSPGPIETPIYGKMGMTEEQRDALGQAFSAMVPMKRFGRAEEVASVVAFLAPPMASYVTGVEIPVDGGFTQL